MTIPAPLTGVVPPVCTPLTPDREVDVPSLIRLVDHLVEGGVHGLFVLGSSSEAAYLTDTHRRLVVSTVVSHVGGQLPVLAGAIDMTTPRVLDHVEYATSAGADAVVVTAPSTPAPTPPRSPGTSASSPHARPCPSSPTTCRCPSTPS